MRVPHGCVVVSTYLWSAGDCGRSRKSSDGQKMLRVILIAIAGASLGSCSSYSLGDFFKYTPPSIQVQLESSPSGADARTSVGPGCNTPCSVSVPAPDTGFSVTYTLNKYQPTTVPVNVIRNPGELGNEATTVTDPTRCSRNFSRPDRSRGVKTRKRRPPLQRTRLSRIRAPPRRAAEPLAAHQNGERAEATVCIVARSCHD